MDWKEVSPGIYKGEYEGFVCHKIFQQTIMTSGIDCQGKRVQKTIYAYTAIKPGPPEPVRFAGNDFEKIIHQIAALLQQSLF